MIWVLVALAALGAWAGFGVKMAQWVETFPDPDEPPPPAPPKRKPDQTDRLHFQVTELKIELREALEHKRLAEAKLRAHEALESRRGISDLDRQQLGITAQMQGVCSHSRFDAVSQRCVDCEASREQIELSQQSMADAARGIARWPAG